MERATCSPETGSFDSTNDSFRSFSMSKVLATSYSALGVDLNAGWSWDLELTACLDCIYSKICSSLRSMPHWEGHVRTWSKFRSDFNCLLFYTNKKTALLRADCDWLGEKLHLVDHWIVSWTDFLFSFRMIQTHRDGLVISNAQFAWGCGISMKALGSCSFIAFVA